MACVDNIVTLGICPDEAASTSGFKLINAAGISIKNLNNTADETYINGVNLALEKKTLAITQVENDLIAAINSNNVATKVSETVYETCIFKPTVDMGIYAGERGLVFYKSAKIRGKLRKPFIESVVLYPLQSGTATLNIYGIVNNVHTVTTQEVELTANMLNTVSVNYLVEGSKVTILIDNTDISFASSAINCGEGCSGAEPNDCGFVRGWDGTKEVKGQGYGMGINFKCYCNWQQIMCDLHKTYIGELIWLKWQYNIFDEQLKSNRFNNWVVYTHDDLPNIMNSISNEYAVKWNALMAGLFTILNNYKDDCLNCRGIRWVVNT